MDGVERASESGGGDGGDGGVGEGMDKERMCRARGRGE